MLIVCLILDENFHWSFYNYFLNNYFFHNYFLFHNNFLIYNNFFLNFDYSFYLYHFFNDFLNLNLNLHWYFHYYWYCSLNKNLDYLLNYLHLLCMYLNWYFHGHINKFFNYYFLFNLYGNFKQDLSWFIIWNLTCDSLMTVLLSLSEAHLRVSKIISIWDIVLVRFFFNFERLILISVNFGQFVVNFCFYEFLLVWVLAFLLFLFLGLQQKLTIFGTIEK